MDYTHLGRTGLQVSRLCLGAACFGYVDGAFGPIGMTAAKSFEIMNLALEAGINFFDTADVYGWDQGVGLSESVVGQWLAQDPSRRDRIVLATKVRWEMSPRYPQETWPNQSGLSARHIKRACEASLRRLGTDHIDLYQMHAIDRATPWEEIWQAMEQLIREGKILYVGSSNFAAWQIAQAGNLAHRRNLLGLVVEQCNYSLLSRTVELEVLPACAAYGMGVVAYEPLKEGILAAPFRSSHEGYRASDRVRSRIERHRAALTEYDALCTELGEPPVAVALSWLLHNPVVTAPVVGWRKPEHLAGSLRALELTLSPDILERLDAIFPGPGIAPDAYAD